MSSCFAFPDSLPNQQLPLPSYLVILMLMMMVVVVMMVMLVYVEDNNSDCQCCDLLHMAATMSQQRFKQSNI